MKSHWAKLVPIGKYKDVSYETGAVQDPSYFKWLLTQCNCIEVKKWLRKARRKLPMDDDDSSS